MVNAVFRFRENPDKNFFWQPGNVFNLNPSPANVPILYPPENPPFLRMYKMGKLVENGFGFFQIQ